MTPYVLDASAVLAYLWKETGWERVERALLADPLISVVNVAEVASKAMDLGISEVDARLLIDNLGMQQHDFDSELAWRAAALRVSTRPRGLSLGDRACLALAQSCNGVALTADKAWLEFEGAFRIECIR